MAKNFVHGVPDCYSHDINTSFSKRELSPLIVVGTFYSESVTKVNSRELVKLESHLLYLVL